MATAPKILVVEADRNTRQSFADAFRQRQWEAVSAEDALVALNMARKEQPHLIVLNDRLPGGGGVSVLKRLRMNVHTAAIPVLGLAEDTGAKKEMLAADAQECMVKPVVIESLCLSIERHLGLPLTVTEAPAESIQAPERLDALRNTGLLDSKADAFLDSLTQMTARLLRVPIALMTLVDKDRQFFKAQVGLKEPWASSRQTPLSHSFCQWAVAGDEQLAISDARQHPVLRSNQAIPDLGVIAYAGAPVGTAAGQRIGTFCIIDAQPRIWTESDLESLHDLSLIAKAHVAMVEPMLPADQPQERMLAKKMQAVTDAISGTTRVLRRKEVQL
ncbi:MAG: response regulator, partial [Candidatus Sericytochromatia bacterium]